MALEKKENLLNHYYHLLSLTQLHHFQNEESIDLCPNNSWISALSRLCLGSSLSNTYHIGVDGSKLNSGAAYIDMIERDVNLKLTKLFGYKYCFCQFLSGMQATTALFQAILKSGDVVFSLPCHIGGHYCHHLNGSLQNLNVSVVAIPTYKNSPIIHLDELADLLEKHKPKLLLIGSNQPLFHVNLEQINAMAKQSNTNSLRNLSLKHIDQSINFIPKWGKNRLRGMIESRPDWCISRQRAWGLPIPAFKTASGSILLTPDSVRAVAKRMLEKGSDAWFSERPEELLRYYNPKLDSLSPPHLELHTLEKMYDIFDVWFESGSSWKAVLEERFHTTVADVYLEGSDQHRGWFHLSLLPSIGIHQKAPFKHLVTHGFMVDKDGYKMSKSTGNALNVDDLLQTYGADVLRWWVASLNPENDIKVDLEFFNVASDSYRKVRNTFRFLLSNLYDFSCEIKHLNSCIDEVKSLPCHDINYFILQELSRCQAAVTAKPLRPVLQQDGHDLIT